jgi:beta-lactam-binding protein with PASTA domain
MKKFIQHYIVKNVVILILAGIFIYYGTLVVLRHYTHHGEALPVPDVTGLTIEEAGTVLQGQKMRWQLADSVYVTSVKPGTVVNQNPEAGFKVKENRNIFLIINAMAAEKVKMPDVTRVSFRQAKTMLESQGLTVGKTTYIPHMAKNYVLKQSYRGQEIRKGAMIVKGSEIELVLGSGLSDEKTPVPSILGKTLLEAHQTLTQYFLSIGVTIYDDNISTSADSLKAFIYRQRPAASADAMLQLGSSIDVWVTVNETLRPNTHQE